MVRNRKKMTNKVVDSLEFNIGQSPTRSPKVRFHWDLWTLMALENIVLDFGRPLAMTWVPEEWFPRNMPSLGDYFHMAYNVLTPFLLLKLIERSPPSRRLPSSATYLTVILFVMGASIHLVGDSVMHRLIFSGYQQELSVAENPVMKNLQPSSLINSFEVLYLYDEVIGHYMWYLPLFALLCIYYTSCFTRDANSSRLPVMAAPLVLISALFYWYLATEGQIFPAFFAMFLFMMIYTAYTRMCHNENLDSNGTFLFWTTLLAHVFVVTWVGFLWDDKAMRHKYTGFFYVPEPWTYYLYYYKV